MLTLGSHISSYAQSSWPSKPVNLIVPFPAGGGTDAFARPLSALFAKQAGKPMVIDNRGGAGGMIAARPEIKEAATVAKANGLFLKKLVEHLDEQFKDTTITDKALEGFLKVKRPENSLPSEPEGEGESESEG